MKAKKVTKKVVQRRVTATVKRQPKESKNQMIWMVLAVAVGLVVVGMFFAGSGSSQGTSTQMDQSQYSINPDNLNTQ